MQSRSDIYKSYFILLIITSSVLISCDTDDAPDEVPAVIEGTFPGVDERLWPYVARFQQEASERDIIVDLVALGITGVIEIIDEENVAGICSFNSRASNHVMIDQEFWESAPDLFKEFIVFHELGHCALLRDHREGADENGRCISMMRSGLEECRDNYSFVTRLTYLDELYDSTFANDIRVSR